MRKTRWLSSGFLLMRMMTYYWWVTKEEPHALSSHGVQMKHTTEKFYMGWVKEASSSSAVKRRPLAFEKELL